MADLTEEDLELATTVGDRLASANRRAYVDRDTLNLADRLQRAAIEIRRHRARLADKERVRQVVRDAVLKAFEAYDHGHNANRSEMVDHAATRVADELCKETP